MEMINSLIEKPNSETIDLFFTTIKNYTDWGVKDGSWPNQFMKDSELNWLEGEMPVADL